MDDKKDDICGDDTKDPYKDIAMTTNDNKKKDINDKTGDKKVPFETDKIEACDDEAEACKKNESSVGT